MKTTAINKNLGALMAVALSTASVLAAGTDTWVGNTDANWSTAANWTTSGGSTPPAGGDSLMFGAAGSSGASLTNDISGLSIYNLSFGSSASAFTFGGNAVTFGGMLTNAGSANQAFSSGVVIAGGAATTVKNAGSGALALGSLTQAAGGFGTVDFTTNSTGAINTTTPNVNGILGGWATVNNNVSSGTVGGWAAVDGSGNFVPYAGYTAGVPSGVTNLNNYRGGNATISGNATVNSFIMDGSGDVTIANNVTLTLSSGGLFIGGTQRWLKNGGGGSTIKSGLSTGELYLHCNNGTFTDFEIQPTIADGSVATTVIKDGPGVLKFAGNGKTYTGGTIVAGGTLQLQNGGGTACVRNTLTISPGATVTLNTGDALGYNSGQVTTPININGGTLNDAVNNNQGYISTFNLMGGTMSSTGGGQYNFNGSSSALNSLATNIVSTVSGPVLLRGNGLSINTAQGTVPGGIDMVISGAISGGNPFSKDGAGTLELINTNSANGTVTINAGTLQLGDGSARNGTLAGNINDNATLVFANPNPQMYSGTISGGGALVKTGAGTLTLSSANSYGGSTTISNGAVMITAPATGGGALTLVDGTTLGITASSDSTYLSASSMTVGSSTGATLQFGVVGTTTAPLNPATLTLHGITTINIAICPFVSGVSYPLLNNYTNGTLAAFTLGTQPTGIYGQLAINGSTVYYTVTNVVLDVWTATVSTNWDTATANWTNDVGGNLFVSNYPVQFDDSAVGASPLLVNIPTNVTPGIVMVSNMTKNYVIGGAAIAGSGGLTMNGANTLTLAGTNTFTGPMTISAGTVAIGGAGQLGSGTYSGAIADNSLLNYGSSSAQTLSGVISGSGALVHNSTGTLTVSGANTYSGGTTNTSGLTLAGNANAFGSGTITMNGGAMNLTTAAPLTIANPMFVIASTTNTLGYAAGNKSMTLSGPITGSGVLQNSANAPTATSTVFFTGDASQFTGTFLYNGVASGNGQYWRFGATGSTYDASQANFVINGGNGKNLGFPDNSGAVILDMGSLSGNGYFQGAYFGSGSGSANTLQVGFLNTSTTFSGQIGVATHNMNNLGLTKVGTGTLTLSGQSVYTGATVISNGVVALGVTNNGAVSGPLGAGGPITFAGGTLRYSASNSYDYSARIANSASPISIDVNGTNATFAAALSAGNTNGLALTNSTGSGKLTLTAGNLYTGTTAINGGTLALSGNGNIASSANITVASGATFDVSGVASGYTLGSSQTLSGSGTVTGSVATASSVSAISEGTAGVVGTLTFNNNLNLSSGAAVTFKLSTSAASGNDNIVLNNAVGALTIGSLDIIHVAALSGAANLDQTADYVLFNVAGTTAMSAQPALIFDGTAPANASHYLVTTSGNNVVLRYSASAAPLVTSVIVTNTANGTPVATHGQFVTVYVIVTPGSGTVTNVSANLSFLGGSASQTLTPLGGNNYSYTLQVGPGAALGVDTVIVTATDTTPLNGSGVGTLTVNAVTDTWNGLASDNNWSSGTNWVGSVPPGYAGDSVIFIGSTRTTPNMDTNYNVSGVTFDSAAGSFTIGSLSGNTLTLSGGVANNSTNNAQTLNVPIVLNGTQTIQDSGAGITLGSTVSGSGLTVGAGVVTLGGSNTYSGDTTISGGSLKVANTAAIPSGAGKGNVDVASGATLNANGINVSLNGLTDAGTVDNTAAGAASLTLGNADTSSAFTGTIQSTSGALSLVKVGAGAFTISKNNTYSGDTKILAGSVVLPSGAVSAFSTNSVTISNATIVVHAANGSSWNSANACYLGNNLIVPAGTTNVIDDSVNNFGNLWIGGDNVQWTGTGIINFQNNSGVTRPAMLWNGNPLATFQGAININPSSGTAFNYSVLNGIAYSSANGGTGAQITTFDSSGTAWNLGDVGQSLTQVIDAGCTTVKMGSISGSNTNTILRGNNSSSLMTALVVGALNTSTTFGGQITDFGAGGTALTKIGSGSLTLLSTGNTYSGPTTVSNGALLVNGKIASPVIVNGGAFGGIGTVRGAVTVNSGGTLAPGARAVGTLTISNNLTLAGNTLVKLSKGLSPAQSNDFVNVTGTLSYGGTLTVSNLGPALAVGNNFRVFPAGGTGSMTVMGNAGSGLAFSFSDGVVSVVTAGPSGPGIITNSVSGNTLTLSWPAGQGWKLQMQTNSLATGLGTNWVYMTDGSISSTNITINPAKPTAFYRLVYP